MGNGHHERLGKSNELDTPASNTRYGMGGYHGMGVLLRTYLYRVNGCMNYA